MTPSYSERPPRAELAGAVRAVWVQRTGATAFVQRNLPTGGVEIHCPIGGRSELIGPLTGPNLEVVPPHTTVVGARFHPGAGPPLPTVLDDLVDRRVGLEEVWGGAADRLGEAMANAPGPEAALDLLQDRLLHVCRSLGRVDPLVREAVRLLMPWRTAEVGAVAEQLAISSSQLRRRCLHAVGVGPKTLQRTLRFQGFLALAQAGLGGSARGYAALAAEAGYADQAHLGRECLSLTGLTPRDLVGRCDCGHDHAASYTPFLANRAAPPPR
ncbi:helix-turn-helix domain-containing protein [Glycomyces sp. TRM65418]|uniref:DUF6597 domain-containing transcriptional factor n=1 Tax=Glycomyces sp. TRM65418 TaxID=2867006 RepID=UPI001CE70A3B|nr:DUF6597 domain-containing transcriptional factor [Glycomyces sp. TRM65418]MCC3765889.1 helix-turn-helix domain-containing protein [Glycomyces sp. TRM65418]QZD55472.1 helix-turn-helix domain-containing protein [Glycomyces sp. TRM65418]